MDFLQSVIKIETFLGEANLTLTFLYFLLKSIGNLINVNVKFASPRNFSIFICNILDFPHRALG